MTMVLDASFRSRFRAAITEDHGKIAPMRCPCCNREVDTPSLDVAMYHYGLTPSEGRVLAAVWRGRGLPVSTERIFDAMYADDPDGGPTPERMYLAFKVRLCRLRKKLEGSGISVVNEGYRRGYRLNLGSR